MTDNICTECGDQIIGPDNIGSHGNRQKCVDSLRSRLRIIADTLRAIEWSGAVDGQDACPYCGAYEDSDTTHRIHADGCEVHAFLANY